MFGFCRVLLIDITLDIHTATCHPFQQSQCFFFNVWMHIYAVLMYARTYICVMVTSLYHLQGRQEFQPWGNCFDNSLWIHHFQKDPALMQRRYERAAAGKSICGEGTKIGLQFFVQSFDFVILKTSKLGEELELFVSSCSAL